MEWIDVIGNLGFPIAVAAYALWNSYKHEQYLQGVLDSTIKENTAVILQLKDAIESAVENIGLVGRKNKDE